MNLRRATKFHNLKHYVKMRMRHKNTCIFQDKYQDLFGNLEEGWGGLQSPIKLNKTESTGALKGNTWEN